MIRKKRRMFFFATPFTIVLEFLPNAIRQGETKDNSWEGKSKLPVHRYHGSPCRKSNGMDKKTS